MCFLDTIVFPYVSTTENVSKCSKTHGIFTGRNYWVFEQETLAILESLLKWEDRLQGYKINVVTDHKALEFFDTQKHLSGRQMRWMEYLSHFDYNIQYMKGWLNKVADALLWYYKSDTWYDVHPLDKYVNADVWLDQEMDHLLPERLGELLSKKVQMHAARVESTLTTCWSQWLLDKQEARDLEAAKIASRMKELTVERELSVTTVPQVKNPRNWSGFSQKKRICMNRVHTHNTFTMRCLGTMRNCRLQYLKGMLRTLYSLKSVNDWQSSLCLRRKETSFGERIARERACCVSPMRNWGPKQWEVQFLSKHTRL